MFDFLCVLDPVISAARDQWIGQGICSSGAHCLVWFFIHPDGRILLDEAVH